MNSDLIMPLLLQITGVIVIIAEIIIPSGGILAIIAAFLFGYSLYSVFTQISVFAGCLFLGADLLVIPVLVINGLKLLAGSPVTLRRSLSRDEGVISQPFELKKLIGKEGITITNLRPSGKARIAGKKMDVVSRGEYIEKDSEISVHAVSGNQIVVVKKF
ncbi:MAG: NfeD family protein [Desulfobacterales bacterium]